MNAFRALAGVVLAASVVTAPLSAHSLRKQGEAVQVADSDFTVTPDRDWNRVSGSVGKNTETWTLDGTQLNDLTFYGGIEPGKPLVKERSKKKEPLPKFTKATLLVEVPELLEGTYRAFKDVPAFTLTSTKPAKFLGKDGVEFAYEYTDADNLVRKGEARAAIINGKLYMATFDAPRLYYYDRVLSDYRSLIASAHL